MDARRFLLFVGLVCITLPAPALEARFSLEAGAREGQFDWSIAHPRGQPNILSELDWRGLDFSELSLHGELRPRGPVWIRGVASYGWADGGAVRDSDYASDGRTDEFSRSESRADGSNFLTLSAAAVFRPRGLRGEWHLWPQAGLAYRYQALRLTDGRQTVNSPANPTPLGAIADLDSWYRASWFGPWLGAELGWTRKPWSLALNVEWHPLGYYRAEADWNLRPDLAHPVSFTHEAWGRGWVLGLTARYEPKTGPWFATARLNYESWRAGSGTDTVYGADGGTVSTEFNGARWENHGVSLGLGYRF